MNKRLLFTCLLLLLSAGIHGGAAAQDYPTSLVLQAGGEVRHVIPVREIGKITFDGGKMQIALMPQAQQQEGYPQSVDLRSISKCFFSNRHKPTGIMAMIEQTGLRYIAFCHDGRLQVAGLREGTVHRLAILSMDGTMVMQHNAFMAGETIDVGTLPAGVYLVRIDRETLKFVK